MFRNTAMGQDHIYSRTAQNHFTFGSLTAGLWHGTQGHDRSATPWTNLCGFGVSKLQIRLNPESWTNYEMLCLGSETCGSPGLIQIATPCADVAQLGSASILKRSSNPLWRRFRRWTQSYLESNMSPKSPNSENAELMGSDEDSTRDNIINTILRYRKYE